MKRAGRLARASVLILIVLSGCNSLPVLPNSLDDSPTAHLTVTPAQGVVPFEALIDSGGSSDPDGRIVLRELQIDGGPWQEIEEVHSHAFHVPGSYRLSLRVTDDSGKTGLANTIVVAEASGGSVQRFRIDLFYPDGRVAARERQAFETAAGKWSRVVTGELSDASVRPGQVEQACGSDYSYAGPIDDLLLFGDVRELDGPGGVIGMAGACLLRSDGFPLVGVIVLDRADVDFLAASGDLPTVVLHELGHVLDLSMSGWQRRGLLEHDRSNCFESRAVRFTGEVAGREFARLGGIGQVPVEDNGVAGTACSHWDEETFHVELMTGYLDRDAPLSRITGGALADMGYRVDLEATDDFTLAGEGGIRAQGSGRAIRERLLPVGAVLGDDGDLQPLPPVEPLDLELRLPDRIR